MSGIQSSVGLISGIDYTSLVNQLIELDSAPKTRLENKLSLYNAEYDAITNQLALLLKSIYMITNLNKAEPYQRCEVSSSNSILTVTKNGTPIEGTYTFTPLQTAMAQQTITTGVVSDTDALGKTGTITIGKGWDLSNSVNLSSLNGGSGISKGYIRITDGSGTRATIDLRSVNSMQDVLDAINNTTSIDVYAELDGDSLVLTDMSGGDMSKFKVQDINGGTTAKSLGLLTDGAVNDGNGTITGTSLYRLGESMQLSQLNDGNGVVFDDVWADIVVKCKDGSTVNIDFYKRATTAEIAAGKPEITKEVTLGDLIHTINSSADANGVVGKVQARISDDGKSLVIEDTTTGTGTTQLTQLSTNPIFKSLGLIQGDYTGSPVILDNGTITTRHLVGDLDSTLMSNLNGGNGLAGVQAGIISVQDKAGNAADIEITQQDLALMHTAKDALRIMNQKLSNAGIGIELKENDAGTGFVLADTTGGAGALKFYDKTALIPGTPGVTGVQGVKAKSAAVASNPGQAALTFNQTDKVNGLTFEFTNAGGVSAYDTTSKTLTVYIPEKTVGETDEDYDAAVKTAIETALADIAGIEGVSVEPYAGLGAAAYHDAVNGGQTAVKKYTSGTLGAAMIPAIPAIPAVPGVNAVSAAVTGEEGTALLTFNDTAAVNGKIFAFTADNNLAGYDAATDTFTIYLSQEIIDETDAEAQDAAVKQAVEDAISAAGISGVTVEATAGLGAQAVADAASGGKTAVDSSYGGTLGVASVAEIPEVPAVPGTNAKTAAVPGQEGTAILTFNSTDDNTTAMNYKTFGFTTVAGTGGYDPGTGCFTVDISGLTTDAEVKQAIDDALAAAGFTGITVEGYDGLAAAALADANSGGLTAVKGYPTGTLGVTHIEGVEEVPDKTLAGGLAKALGFDNAGFSYVGTTVKGTLLNRQVVSYNTPLSDWNNGQGVTLAGGKFIITDSKGAAATIAVNAATTKTVGDVIKLINNQNTGILARLNDTGDGILLEDRSGGTGGMSVVDADGVSHFAADLGIAGNVARTKNGDGTVNTSEYLKIDAKQSYSIDVEATDSLDTIRQKINALGANFSATIVNDGSDNPFRLVIAGKNTGAAGAFNVNLTALGLSAVNMSEARDALLVYGDATSNNGVTLHSSTNKFANVINGIDITVNGVASSPVTVTSASSNLEVKVSLQTFVENYNAWREQFNKDTYFIVDEVNGVQGNILYNSKEMREFGAAIDKMLLTTISNIPGINSLASLGVTMTPASTDGTTNTATGLLSFDEDVFIAAWESNKEGVIKFFYNPYTTKDADGKATTVNQGWAQKFQSLVDTFTGSADGKVVGKFSTRMETLDRLAVSTQSRVDYLQERLDFRKQMMLNKFYAMETALARMSSDMTTVSSIATNWANNVVSKS